MNEAAPAPDAGHRRVLLIIGLLAALLGLMFIKRTWTDGDEGRYLGLATAIAQGEGQTLSHLPVPEPEWLTPPGYITALGWLHRATGGDLFWLRFFSLLCYVLGCVAFAAYALRRDGRPGTILLPALVAGLFTVPLLSHSWMFMTETPFFLVMALSMWVAADNRGPGRNRRAFTAGALCGLAMLIRPAGIALLPALLAVYALRRHFLGVLLALLGFGLLFSPTIIRSMRLIGVPFPHMTHFASEAETGSGGGLTRLMGNIVESFPAYYTRDLPSHLLYSLFDYRCLLCLLGLGSLVKPLSILVAVLVTIGFLARLRRPGVGEFFWIAYWPFLCSYNQPDYEAAGIFLYQARYLLPILPLAGWYLVEGLGCLGRLLPGRGPVWPRVGPALGLAVAAYVLLAALGAGVARLRNEAAVWGRSDFDPVRQYQLASETDHALGTYLEAAHWLASNTPPDAVVASRKPEHVWLVSQRRGFRYDGADLPHGSAHELTNVWDIILSQSGQGPLYILEDGFPAGTGYGNVRIHALVPALAAHEDDLELLMETRAPTARVWRVRTNPAGP